MRHAAHDVHVHDHHGFCACEAFLIPKRWWLR
jgi:hypothetical protein